MTTQLWQKLGEDGVTRKIWVEVDERGMVLISVDVLAELMTDNGWEHIETR